MERYEELKRVKKAARRLYEGMAFSIIPCHHPCEPPPKYAAERWSDDLAGKMPMVPWKEFQAVNPSAGDVARWFYGDALHNIAVVTGAISQVVVLDLDDEEAVKWADATMPGTPLRVAASRGQHWYYRWDAAHPMSNTARLCIPDGEGGELKLHADIRGEGGYVLAPGSRHKSGHLYATVPNGSSWKPGFLATLPPFPSDMFRPAMVEEPADDPAPPAAPRRVPEPTGDPLVKLERRLIAYIDKIPGLKEHDGRNNAAYGVALNLINDFAAPESMSWDLLVEWNAKNQPPLAEQELRTTFNSAKKNGGKHARGWKADLDRGRPVLRLVKGAAIPQEPATEGNLALQEEPEHARQIAASSTGQRLTMIPWHEIPEGSGWDFIIEPAIPRGAVTILSGDGGLGKSLLACKIVADASVGSDILDRRLVQSFRSTVFFMEDSLGEVKRRLIDMGYKGETGAINIYDNREEVLSLSAEHIYAVGEAAEAHGSHLIVIDPLVKAAAAANVDMNNPTEARAAVDCLTEMARRLNVAVLLIHHHNSSGTIQGGKAWSNAVRSHLTVYRHPLEREKVLCLHAKNNCGEMTTFTYRLIEAHAGDRHSVVVDVLGESPAWNYQRIHELTAGNRALDAGSVREAVRFLKIHLPPGTIKEKKSLVANALADGIRMNDLTYASTILGVKRDYVPQYDGGTDLLCWEMPHGGTE